jgi:hypothetical protein
MARHARRRSHVRHAVKVPRRRDVTTDGADLPRRRAGDGDARDEDDPSDHGAS